MADIGLEPISPAKETDMLPFTPIRNIYFTVILFFTSYTTIEPSFRCFTSALLPRFTIPYIVSMICLSVIITSNNESSPYGLADRTGLLPS